MIKKKVIYSCINQPNFGPILIKLSDASHMFLNLDQMWENFGKPTFSYHILHLRGLLIGQRLMLISPCLRYIPIGSGPQPASLSPRWVRYDHFLNLNSFSCIFSHFASLKFLYFLLNFGLLGEKSAHLGRPWLCRCIWFSKNSFVGQNTLKIALSKRYIGQPDRINMSVKM